MYRNSYTIYIQILMITMLTVLGFTDSNATEYPIKTDTLPRIVFDESISEKICNNNANCDGLETCGNCSADCGICSIEKYMQQRSKYIDKTCKFSGNGLVDSCASVSGGVGRFNKLQAALDTLVAGDTLYVHPGDYWRDHMPEEGPHGIYTVLKKSGTRNKPIIVTAADNNNPPTIHSCNPERQSYCQGAAISSAYSNYIIFDHLKVRGLAQIRWGNNNVLQYLDVSYGWGPCADGNWAALRIEGGDSNAARFNYVHDVSGAGENEACEAFPYERNVMSDRGSGLKEFSATNTLWEFNTVVGAPYWGYDLHRNSDNSTIRFNRFERIGGIAIRSERGSNLNVYGNIVIGTGKHGEDSCISIRGVNEQARGRIDNYIINNTCLLYTWGITIDGAVPSKIQNNVVGDAAGVFPPKNIIAPGKGHSINYNAWDSYATFNIHPYDGPKWRYLDSWQRDTGYDTTSIIGPGGACDFVKPATLRNRLKGDYDLRVKGDCKTAGSDGGEVGAYGLTNCVGHDC